MKTIFLTKMNRWGNSEDGHTYISNASESHILALFLGERHGKEFRGGKYEPEIIEYIVPEDCKEIWVEMRNLENKTGDFVYNIHTSGDSEIKLAVSEAEESRLTIWNHEIETDAEALTDEEDVKGILDHSLNCYSGEVQEYIKSKYEALLRQKS